MDAYFDEEGDLTLEALNYLNKKMKDQGYLDGNDALLWMADEYAGETHGNYCAQTVYSRASYGKCCDVRITTRIK